MAPHDAGDPVASIGPALGVEERVRLMRDGLLNYSGLLVSGLVGVVLVPIMLRGLGAEAYGVWIAALAVVSVASVLDLGLGACVAREVAARLSGSHQDEAVRFVTAVGTAYLILGIVGGLVVGLVGLPLSGGLHLSAATQRIAPVVFALAGIVFFNGMFLTLASCVLQGLRQFGLANLVTTASMLVRAVGVVALIWSGRALTAVATWEAMVSAATAFAALSLVGRLEPRFRLRWGRLDWASLRTQISFSFESLLTALASNFIWQVPTVLIGLVRGSAWVVPYYIGQKFPLAASGVSWRAAEALFPAASQHERAQDLASTRELLEVGTRWILVLMLPLCLVLWIIAPNLLRAWLGEARGETVWVMRLMAAAVFGDALGVGAMHVLWGRGSARRVVMVLAGVMTTSLALSLWLLVRIGIVGVAWGMCVALILGSVVLLHVSSRTCGTQMFRLLRAACKGLALPAGTCAAFSWAITYFISPERWVGAIGTAAGAGVVYAVGLYLGGSRREERVFAQEILSWPARTAYSTYRATRRVLRRVGFLRSGWYFVLASVDLIRETGREPATFQREFERRVDPWDSASAREQARFCRAVEMLDGARGGRCFPQALEVGCAEGAFTEWLAPRCASLLAVDISPAALARVQTRCCWGDQVRFLLWDLRRDPLPGSFDLIVVMSVLDYFCRPSALRAARAKLVEGVRQGGYLLVGNPRQDALYETAWWGKRLIRGGKWINAFMGEHPALKVVATETTELCVLTLFEKLS